MLDPARVGQGSGDDTGPLAVRTEGLTKRFRGGQVAVDDLALRVPRGAVYGFLGPNGSGKTTTIRMLLGLVRPTAGTAWLLDAPVPEASASVLPRVGALVEGPAFHPYLSGRDNLARLEAADA
ncbi:ATP-binding cassette domain-containing protein, partial [Cellulomonas septica]|nr:ATP-binding cassette domain-containing protein [Cellulomonas septica]